MREYFINMKTKNFNKYLKEDFGTDFYFETKIENNLLYINRVPHKTCFHISKGGKLEANFIRYLTQKLGVLPIEFYYFCQETTRLNVKILDENSFFCDLHDIIH